MTSWPPEPSVPGDRPPSFPPPSWPSKGQLDYTRTAIVVTLLFLALPWLVLNLLTRPGEVIEGLGTAVVKKGPGV